MQALALKKSDRVLEVGTGSGYLTALLAHRSHQVFSVEINPRLKAMAETQDGFEIARRDLEIRGPGEFLGARQSGAPLLRFADLATDVELLAWARESAPLMLDRHNALAQRHILRWLGGKADYLKA